MTPGRRRRNSSDRHDSTHAEAGAAIKALIFDIDGTLLESANVDDELYRRAVTEVLGPVCFRGSLTEYSLVTDGGVLSEILDDNNLGGIADPTDAIRTRFVELLESHITEHGAFAEIPGAKEFLGAHRRSSGHAVAIATGGWRPSAMLKLETAGFEVDGLPIATSDDHFDRAEIMLLALSKLGTDFESVTYYGDGVWDKQASAALGWQFVPVGPTLNGLDAFPGPDLSSERPDAESRRTAGVQRLGTPQ